MEEEDAEVEDATLLKLWREEAWLLLWADLLTGVISRDREYPELLSLALLSGSWVALGV